MASNLDHRVFQEWLDRALDDGLTPGEQSSLRGHLATCADCRAERDKLIRLRELIEQERIPVRGGFSRKVLDALPAAGWESRKPRAWRLPAAVLAALVAATAGLVATSAPLAGADTALPRALWMIVELWVAGTVAGAGLLGASWRGMGLVVQSLLAGSVPAMLFFAAAVLGLYLLLFRLLRRPVGLAAVRSRDRSKSSG
jgi:hypothetical protein